MTSDAHEVDRGRRAFLVGVCGLAAVGMGSALLADDALAATGIVRKKNGQVEVSVKKVPGLRQVGSSVLLGNVKGVPTAVIRTGPNAYSALNLKCTHQGVTVVRTGDAWNCPAHGSQFAFAGGLERGPAQSPLASVRSTFNARKGVLTVG
jgi:Rieske Fe-S protein